MKPNELTTIKEEVIALLKADARLRDSDNKLWCRIVANHLGGIAFAKSYSAYELLVMVSEGKLPSFESVSRRRRDLQNEYPELRGEKYAERQEFQDNIRQELGYKL
jgi:hypothetical protein